MSLSVRSLLGHRGVDLALQCLGSLIERSVDPLQLILHDDGTLTAEDCDRLAAGLRQPLIVRKTDATEQVLPRLARYPACAQFRQTNVLGLKLLDVPLLGGDTFAYCDTDVF